MLVCCEPLAGSQRSLCGCTSVTENKRQASCRPSDAVAAYGKLGGHGVGCVADRTLRQPGRGRPVDRRDPSPAQREREQGLSTPGQKFFTHPSLDSADHSHQLPLDRTHLHVCIGEESACRSGPREALSDEVKIDNITWCILRVYDDIFVSFHGRLRPSRTLWES